VPTRKTFFPGIATSDKLPPAPRIVTKPGQIVGLFISQWRFQVTPIAAAGATLSSTTLVHPAEWRFK